MKGINESSSSSSLPQPQPRIQEDWTPAVNTTSCTPITSHLTTTTASHPQSNNNNNPVRTSTPVALESRNEEETTTSTIPRDDFTALLESYFQQDSSSSYKDSYPFATTTTTSESTARTSIPVPKPTTTTIHPSSFHRGTNIHPSYPFSQVVVEAGSSSSSSLPLHTSHKNLPKVSFPPIVTTIPKSLSGLWSFLYSIHQHEQRVFQLLCQSTASSASPGVVHPPLLASQIQACMYEYQKLYPPLMEYLKDTRMVMKNWELGLDECKLGLSNVMNDTTASSPSSSTTTSYWNEWMNTLYQQVHTLRVEYDCIHRMVEEYPKSNVVIPPMESTPSKNIHARGEDEEDGNPEMIRMQPKGNKVYSTTLGLNVKGQEAEAETDGNVYSIFNKPMPTTPPPTPQGMLYPSPPCKQTGSSSMDTLIFHAATTPLLMMPNSPFQTARNLAQEQEEHDDEEQTRLAISHNTKKKKRNPDDTTTNIEEESKKKKRKKDKTLPKRPLSAYNLFFCDQRSLLLQQDPQQETDSSLEHLIVLDSSSSPPPSSKRPHRKTHGKISFQDLAKTIGSKWQHLSVEEKSVYEKRAQEEKQRYFQIKWEQQQQQQQQHQQERMNPHGKSEDG